MKHSVERRALLVAAIICIASQHSAQGQSLIERARANGGTSRTVVDVDGPVLAVESIVEPSSLILRGRVRSATTKIGPDETAVVTEYELIPIRLYKGSVPPLDRP